MFENPHRPSIRDGMVHGPLQDVILFPQPQQGSPKKRTFGEIKGFTGFLGGQPSTLGFALDFWKMLEINHRREGERLWRNNALKRASIDSLKGGTQDLVT